MLVTPKHHAGKPIMQSLPVGLQNIPCHQTLVLHSSLSKSCAICQLNKRKTRRSNKQQTFLQWKRKKPHPQLIYSIPGNNVKHLHLGCDDCWSQSDIDGKSRPSHRAFTSVAEKQIYPRFNLMLLAIKGHFNFVAAIDLCDNWMCVRLWHATL